MTGLEIWQPVVRHRHGDRPQPFKAPPSYNPTDRDLPY
jgi:hypothetical protein